MGHRSPLRQHSGLVSHGGVGEWILEKKMWWDFF